MHNEQRTKYKQLTDHVWLKEEYSEKRRSIKEIAAEIGCSSWSVANVLKHLGIPRRKTGEQRTGQIRKSKYPELNNKAWLIEHYIDKRLNEHEIASIINAKSGGSVLQALGRFKIERREPVFHRKAGTSLNYPILNNAEWLRQKYIDEKLSSVDIAQIIGCPSASQITQSLRRHGIPVYSVSEGHLRNSKGDGFVLNDTTSYVLTGCLLGDGGLRTNHKNSWNPVFYKCNIHYDHIVYVAKLLFGERHLERISGPVIQGNGSVSFGGKTYKTQPIFHLRSLTHPELKSWYEKWYPEANCFKKFVPADIKLNATVLLHWFLDDGYSYIVNRKYSNSKYNKQKIRVYFSTQSFERNNLFFLSERIKADTGFNITPRYHQRDNNVQGTGYEMSLSESQSVAFFEFIGSPVVQSLAYKWKYC